MPSSELHRLLIMKLSYWSSRSKSVATVLLAAALIVAAGRCRRSRSASHEPQARRAVGATRARDRGLRLAADHRPAGRHGQQRRLPGAHQRHATGAGPGRPLLRQRSHRPALHPRPADEERRPPTWISTAADRAPACSTSSTTDAGLASGFISFEFDPDYARNGRFYTIHLEETALPGIARAGQPERSRSGCLRLRGRPRRSRRPARSTTKAC